MITWREVLERRVLILAVGWIGWKLCLWTGCDNVPLETGLCYWSQFVIGPCNLKCRPTRRATYVLQCIGLLWLMFGTSCDTLVMLSGSFKEIRQGIVQSVCIYLITYLLTPWCRVLLEKVTGLQLVKKFPSFHGTLRFITALTSVHHLSLSWPSPIQSTYPHPTSWRSILILSTHLRLGLPSGLFPSGFPTKTLYIPFPHPYAPHAQPISFFSILSPAQYWVRSTSHLAPCYTVSSIPPLPHPS